MKFRDCQLKAYANSKRKPKGNSQSEGKNAVQTSRTTESSIRQTTQTKTILAIMKKERFPRSRGRATTRYQPGDLQNALPRGANAEKEEKQGRLFSSADGSRGMTKVPSPSAPIARGTSDAESSRNLTVVRQNRKSTCEREPREEEEEKHGLRGKLRS